MVNNSGLGAPILPESEHGYALNLPVEIPEQDTETTENCVPLGQPRCKETGYGGRC